MSQEKTLLKMEPDRGNNERTLRDLSRNDEGKNLRLLESLQMEILR